MTRNELVEKLFQYPPDAEMVVENINGSSDDEAVALVSVDSEDDGDSISLQYDGIAPAEAVA
jgi:hypothetical protein